jgi:hypothetical protein
MQEATLTTWEMALDDLPDVWLPDGRHLGTVVAVDLIRNADRLVMPREFRAAYRARAPRMGHAEECGCTGVGWVQVDASENRWRPCPGPVVALPEQPAVVAIEPAAHPIARELAARVRARSAAAPEEDRPVRRYRLFEQRPAWHRPDETYFADLEGRRQTETEPPPPQPEEGA